MGDLDSAGLARRIEQWYATGSTKWRDVADLLRIRADAVTHLGTLRTASTEVDRLQRPLAIGAPTNNQRGANGAHAVGQSVLMVLDTPSKARTTPCKSVLVIGLLGRATTSAWCGNTFPMFEH